MCTHTCMHMCTTVYVQTTHTHAFSSGEGHRSLHPSHHFYTYSVRKQPWILALGVPSHPSQLRKRPIHVNSIFIVLFLHGLNLIQFCSFFPVTMKYIIARLMALPAMRPLLNSSQRPSTEDGSCAQISPPCTGEGGTQLPPGPSPFHLKGHSGKRTSWDA